MALTDIFKTVADVFEAAAPYAVVGATTAGVVLPFFLSDDAPAAPAYQPTTAQQLQDEAAQESARRRRELARRRGSASTIKTTPLGIEPGFGIRVPDARPL